MLNVYTFALAFIFLCVFFESDRSVLKLNYISNKIIFFMLASYLVLLAGLRYGIETDYWNYEEIFRTTTMNNRVGGIEKGFHTLILFYKVAFSSKNFNGFIFMLALISVGLKLHYISMFKEPFVALLFYFTGFYIMYEFSTIKQGVVICKEILGNIFLDFYCYLVSFIIYNIFFPTWFFCKMKITKRKIIVFTLAMIFLQGFLF